ncbi:MAG: GTP-binding protein [Bacteroidia bacterium]|nr:GTP-binding protein [Bacteroidia bacterium]
MDRTFKYTCPKCGGTSCNSFNIRTSGTLLTSIFDIQNKKFNAVVCSNCRYTEFYHVASGRRKEL